jgi:hypothetical protein
MLRLPFLHARWTRMVGLKGKVPPMRSQLRSTVTAAWIALAGCACGADGRNGLLGALIDSRAANHAGSAGSSGTANAAGAAGLQGTAGAPITDVRIDLPNIYSANDGGAHIYQVVAQLPGLADPPASDPIMPATINWTFDDSYVSAVPFVDLPRAVLLTTKRAGVTSIRVTAQTQSGTSVHGEARLTISQASDADWQLGSQRYDLGMVVDLTRVCDLTLNASDVPKTAACAECHSKTTGLSVEYTPLQTAGFSDDALIAIFSQGMRPVGLTFENPLLQGSADADCVFKSFHTWNLDDAVTRGMVWKLRSITPAKLE